MSSSTAPTTGQDTSSTADTVTHREDSNGLESENSTVQDANSAHTSEWVNPDDGAQDLQAPAVTTEGFIPTCERPNVCNVWKFYDGGRVPEGALWSTALEAFKCSACSKPFVPGFVERPNFRKSLGVYVRLTGDMTDYEPAA